MYYILNILAQLVIFLVTRCRIHGKENVPVTGPFLVVANHLSAGDPVLIGAKIGRRVTFMAKEELFTNRFSSYFVRRFGAFPVYRGRYGRDALYQANRVLQQGWVLGMFPEGRRSFGNGLSTALNGSALIAYHNQVPILPIGIAGSETIRGLDWIWKRPRITLRIGPTFYLPVTGSRLNREQLSDLTDLIMYHIAELLPEKYRGQYSGKKGYGN